MHQPVTIVKVRKDTTIKVPAGRWMLLCDPEQPLHEHIAARSQLVLAGNISADYAALTIGRIQDTHTPTKFLTPDEAQAHAEIHEKNLAQFKKSGEEAKAIQANQAAAIEKARKDQHAEQLKKINEANDAIRTMGQPPKGNSAALPNNPPPSDELKLPPPEVVPIPLTAETLAKRSKNELLDSIAAYNDDAKNLVKIKYSLGDKKEALITAILAVVGRSVPTAPPSTSTTTPENPPQQ